MYLNKSYVYLCCPSRNSIYLGYFLMEHPDFEMRFEGICKKLLSSMTINSIKTQTRRGAQQKRKQYEL